MAVAVAVASYAVAVAMVTCVIQGGVQGDLLQGGVTVYSVITRRSTVYSVITTRRVQRESNNVSVTSVVFAACFTASTVHCTGFLLCEGGNRQTLIADTSTIHYCIKHVIT